jgi:hypothetical protein
MKLRNILFASAALAVVAGCGPGDAGAEYQPVPAKKIEPATIPAGQEARLFPVKEGNQWSYKVERLVVVPGRQANVPEEFTMRVARVDSNENATQATMELVRNDVVLNRHVWRITKDGVYQVSVGMDNNIVTNQPHQPAIVFPPEKGKTFTWEGKGQTPLGFHNGVYQSEIIGPEEVDTEMGRVSAIKVETFGVIKTPQGEGKLNSSYWFAPDIGLVRWREEVVAPNEQAGQVVMMRLVNHTVRQ